MATHLQQAATPGRIVLSDATHRLVSGYWTTRPLGRIGRRNGIFAPPPRPRAPPAATPHPGLWRAAQRAAAALQERHRARRSTALRGFGWCWTGASGWMRGAPQGCPGATASGRTTWEGWGGKYALLNSQIIMIPAIALITSSYIVKLILTGTCLTVPHGRGGKAPDGSSHAS